MVKYLKTKMDTSEVSYMKVQAIYNIIGEENELLEPNEEPLKMKFSHHGTEYEESLEHSNYINIKTLRRISSSCQCQS